MFCLEICSFPEVPTTKVILIPTSGTKCKEIVHILTRSIRQVDAGNKVLQLSRDPRRRVQQFFPRNSITLLTYTVLRKQGWGEVEPKIFL